MRKIYLMLGILQLLSFGNLQSQCSLYPVSLSDRLTGGSLIVQGSIVGQQSFWNSDHNYIYTSNIININQVIKGGVKDDYVEIITDGGEVGLNKIVVEPSLQLKPGDQGVFVLHASDQPSQFGHPVYKAFADEQGFIRFDLSDNSATDPFKKYDNINVDLYVSIEQILGYSIDDFQGGSAGKFSNNNAIQSVSGFTPTNITAGTSSTLTITGAGFGSTQSTSVVEFKNADDGGATFIQPHSSQYLSWSDTQIQVLVPTRASTVSGTAGTGQIRVTVAGNSTLSAQTLTVDYGELNLYYSTNNTIYKTRHVDLNGNNGITWQMYTGFDANSAAKTAFLSSFQTWRCNTYINWMMGSAVSTNTIALDGVNVVRFDISTELPGGVLGRCTSYFSGCISGPNVFWYVSELDIVFDDPTTSVITWNMGPALATGIQYDFESVSLHELGHGHQLSHVINSNDVMHYALANAQNKRTLISQDINAGNDVMSRNITTGVCGSNSMIALSATNCAVAVPTASFDITSPVCVNQTVALNDLSTGGATSYTWTMTGGSPASSTLQNTSVTYTTAGTYSISFVVANGTGTSSVLTKTISVTSSPTISVASASICTGGTANLTASGSSSYTWNPGALTGSSQSFSPGSTTAYTITGGAGTCTGVTTATVSVVTTPTLNVPTASICAGSSTLITATGASSFTWNPGNLTGAAQTLNPGSTTVYTVTGSNGVCAVSVTTTLSVSASVTVTVPDATICSGTSTMLTATGATNYTWNPGALTGATQNLSPGTTTSYTVIGSSGSCTASAVAMVNVNASPTISASGATICEGSTATITATGAANYTWNPGALTGSLQMLSPTVTTAYTITGDDGVCAAQPLSFTVTVNSTPTISAPDATICAGSSTLITATGAASYTWNPGSLSGASQNLNPAITTAYTVTGANGSCVGNTVIFTITVNSTPSITVPSANICSGTSASLTASGATSFTWNPGNLSGASQTLNPVTTTIYTVTGSDGTCSAIGTGTINVTTTPTVSVPNAVICAGASTLLNANGATTYTWNPGSLNGNSQTLGPLATTVYSISGTTGLCTGLETTFTITVNPIPTIAVSNASICSGASTLLTATGATTFTWNPGALTGAAQNLGPANTTTYTVSGTSLGCTGVSNATVTVAATPTVSAPTASICSGTSTLLTATGATSFTWNPGNLTGAAQNLNPGATTAYTILGATGACTGITTTTVNVTTTPTVSVPDASICSGTSTLMTASGAASFIWNPGNLSGSSQNLNPSATTVYTVTGSNGSCSSTKVFTITVTPTPTVSAPNAAICSGASTLITASGAGSFVWNPGSLSGASQNLGPATTTTYTITGTNGTCTSTLGVTVNVTATPTLSVPNATICSGTSTLVTASGAASFLWNPGTLSGAAQNLNPAATTVYTITGSNGTCSSTATSTITVNTTPTVTVPNATICSGTSTFLTASAAASFTWNPGAFTGASQNLIPATTTVYSVTGLTSGCSSVGLFTITVNPSPTLTMSTLGGVICNGASTVLSVSGTATSYSWNPGNLSGASQTLAPSVNTTYTVSGQLGNCITNTFATVNVTVSPTVTIPSGTICSGTSTILTANGAANYTWNPGPLNGAAQSLSPLVTTVYTVTGSLGFCTHVATTTISVNTTPTVTAPDGTICSGTSTLITAGGATTYTWNPGPLTGGSQNLSPGATTAYSVTGQLGNCTNLKTFTITVNPTPTLTVPNATICSGASTAITVSGAISYSWLPGPLGGTVQTLSPLATTVYTINGVLGSCSSSKQFTITVNPTPTLTAPNATICAGTSTGITVSGATSYTWAPGPLTGSAQILSPNVLTTYSIIGQLGNCTTIKTITVTVAPNPTLSVPNATICSGTSTVLTASGAISFTWSPGPLIGATQTLSPLAPTLYTVTGQLGICSSTAAAVVIVDPTPTITAADAFLCSGTATVLVATGATSYTWEPGTLLGAVQGVTPNVSIVYTVSGSIGNCVEDTIVNVNVTPTPTLILTGASICSGTSAILNAAGANSYTWDPINLTGPTQTLNPNSTTVYTVTGANGPCTSTALTTLSVTTTPTVVVTSGTVCSGRSILITASGASSFTWSPGGLNGNFQVLNPSATTVYTVQGSIGTCTGSAMTTVTVIATPTMVVSNATICSGNSTVITATGANSYSWEPGTLTGVTQTLNPLTNTMYSVTGANGTCTDVVTFIIQVEPTPTVVANASKTLVCTGVPVTINASGASTYTFFPGGIPGSAINILPSGTTTYSVSGETQGCIGQAVITISVTDCTGVNEIAGGNIFRLYPNPGQEDVTLDFGRPFTGNIEIFNSIGQIVKQEKVQDAASIKFEISLFAKGVYLVKIEDIENNRRVIKLIKD